MRIDNAPLFIRICFKIFPQCKGIVLLKLRGLKTATCVLVFGKNTTVRLNRIYAIEKNRIHDTTLSRARCILYFLWFFFLFGRHGYNVYRYLNRE